MTDAAHVDAIDMLARANNRSVQEVEIYMEDLAHPNAHARIQAYLVVLTSKHVPDVQRGASKRYVSKASPPRMAQPS
jgi:hypothetical protein